MSLPSGNADLLVAVRALINMIILGLCHIALEVGKEVIYPVSELKKLLVLRITLLDIAGEHPKIQDDQRSHRDDIAERNAYKPVQHDQDQHYDSDEP